MGFRKNLFRSLIVILIFAVVSVQVVGAASTTTKIDIKDSGDGYWEIEIRQKLENENEINAFKELVSDIDKSNSTQNFKDRLETTVSQANQETDRNMSIKNFSVSASVEGLTKDWGVIRYRFIWKGFADQYGEKIVLRKVLEGYYLEEGDILRINLPSNSTLTTVSPEPEEKGENYLAWIGPQSFGDNEPTIEINLTQEVETPGPAETPKGGDLNTFFITGAIGSIILLIFLAYIKKFRDKSEKEKIKKKTVEEEPLPDKELVVKILKDEGGRLRQKELTEKTDWSEAKVSNITNKLEEEGKIAKRRWGREKVLMIKENREEK